MKSYARAHLADKTLLLSLVANTAAACRATADQLADIGEVDARKLYLPAGHPSMFAFCVHELHMTEQSAYKRIHVARRARRFPAIFHAVAEGQLHLSGALLLAPHMTEDTAEELLAAATNKSKGEIEQLLANRFPRADWPTLLAPANPLQPPVEVVAPMTLHSPELSLGKVDASSNHARLDAPPTLPVQSIESPTPRPRLTPLAPGRFGFQLTIDQETHDMLRYAQALLSHAVSPRDLAAVHKRLIAEGIARLEHRCFGTPESARRGPREATDSRHIPVEVKREVWTRDGGRCTFVSQTGVRCTATEWLQFDHVEAYARGGGATTTNIRLRCSGHNHYEADQTYGAEFMRRKRETSRAKSRAALPIALGQP